MSSPSNSPLPNDETPERARAVGRLPSILVAVGVASALVTGLSLGLHSYLQALRYDAHLKPVIWAFLGSFTLLAPGCVLLLVTHALKVRATLRSGIASLLLGICGGAIGWGILAPVALGGLLVLGLVDMNRSLGRPSMQRWALASLVAGILVLGGFYGKLHRSQALGRELVVAIEQGDIGSVDPLIASGANPNVPGPSGADAVLAAIRSGRLDVVRAVLTRPVNHLGAVQECGASPLAVAVRSGNVQMVELLTNSPWYSPMDSKQMTSPAESPLGEAERMGRQDLIDLLRRR